MQAQYDEGNLFPTGHSDIVHTCLSYMTFKFPDDCMLSMEMAVRNFVFLEYAFLNWGNHARQGDIATEETKAMVDLLQQPQSNHLF
jgi:hypothetical protein